MHAKTLTYPEDSLQLIIEPDDWWVESEGRNLSRGELVLSFVNVFDQTPYGFQMQGRTHAREHDSAEMIVAPLKVDQPVDKKPLPVAAMTKADSEVWAAYRAKRRPCIVIANNSEVVPKELTRKKPNSATAPTIIVAPYFGIEEGKSRSGYNPEFVERVRHCEYPQFMWDHLPMENGVESLLRLDQMQPIGTAHGSYRPLGYKLSDSAIELFEDHLSWYLWEGVSEESMLYMYRQQVERTLIPHPES